MTAVAAKTSPDSAAAEDLRALKRVHREQWEARIRAAMKKADGYPSKAAEILGIHERTMFRILQLNRCFDDVERAPPGNPGLAPADAQKSKEYGRRGGLERARRRRKH